MSNRINYLQLLMLLLMFITSMPAFTVSNDEEVQIEADYMKFDIETGDSIYEGNVSITQGAIKLTGNKVIINRQNEEISKIDVDGNPAEYLQDENTDNKVHATSKHMEYTAKTNRLVLTVDARLEQTSHTVKSQRIVYDTENKVVLAGASAGKNKTSDRVNITLTPKKDNPNKMGE